MLVTPVRLELRRARELQIEMRRSPGRTRGARQDHTQDVSMLVVVDDCPEGEQLPGGLRRVPPADVLRGTLARRLTDALVCRAQLLLEHERVVRARLHVHEQTVERSDVDARCIEPALERLDERRPGAGTRVEHVLAGTNVPREQRLHELRDELAQVGMKTMDVLRPLALREVA